MEVKDYSTYIIHENGDVWSKKTKRYLTHYVGKAGYKVITLCKCGNAKTYTVHRLLAQHFLPNANNLPQVDHIDRDKLNNSLPNLRWVSCSGNSQNLSLSVSNKSGIQNISYNKRDKGWDYQKCVNGVRTRRFFKSKEAAIEYKKQHVQNIVGAKDISKETDGTGTSE